MNLGKLKKVELRDVWKTEAGDFTPWLAREENLQLLGDTIGLDLELEAQEKDVGPFRADILCKDTASTNWVLIENQLEKTDHTHLGQLMTYAAGLKAVTIVWIAQRFTDEHRAAIDWLNGITSEEINFFALEVELWKIGESNTAPKFNIVSQSNVWSKTIKVGPDSKELTETMRLQLHFWTGLKDYLIEHKSNLKSQKPYPAGWTGFPIGRTNFHINCSIVIRDKRIGCALIMNGADSLAHFSLLKNDKENIEREFGDSLLWRGLPGKKEKHISRNIDNKDLRNQKLWPEYYRWFADNVEKFHKVFSQRVKQLDASEYIPDEDDDKNS